MSFRIFQTLTDYHHASAEGHPLPPGVELLFGLAGGLYHLARLLKYGLFRGRLVPVVRLPCLTVSVGNITLGGSGKTPMTAWIARTLAAQDCRVAILSRGYGIPGAAAPGISGKWVARGGQRLLGPREGGDEAVLLAKLAPAADVLVGKRRALTGQRACREGAQAVVLDDGFQYWRLARDLDIVLLDLPLSPSRLRLFPYGTLREPLSRLKAADVIVLTGADRATEADRTAAVALLARHAPEVPCWPASYHPVGLRPLPHGDPLPVDRLRGEPVLAMAGLGRPQGFFASLTGLGARVLPAPFPDHHPYQIGELEHQVRRAQAWGAVAIVMTAKDEVNLPAGYRPRFPVWVLDSELKLDAAGETALAQLFAQKRASLTRSDPRSCPPGRI